MPLQGIAPAHQTAESKLETSLGFPPVLPLAVPCMPRCCPPAHPKSPEKQGAHLTAASLTASTYKPMSDLYEAHPSLHQQQVAPAGPNDVERGWFEHPRAGPDAHSPAPRLLQKNDKAQRVDTSFLTLAYLPTEMERTGITEFSARNRIAALDVGTDPGFVSRHRTRLKQRVSVHWLDQGAMKGGHAKHQLQVKTIRKLKIDSSNFEKQNKTKKKKKKLTASLFKEEQELLFPAT